MGLAIITNKKPNCKPKTPPSQKIIAYFWKIKTILYIFSDNQRKINWIFLGCFSPKGRIQVSIFRLFQVIRFFWKDPNFLDLVPNPLWSRPIEKLVHLIQQALNCPLNKTVVLENNVAREASTQIWQL